MKSNSTVGEDMFEMSGGKDKSTKIKFGFGKIVELTSDGEKIEKVRLYLYLSQIISFPKLHRNYQHGHKMT